VRKLDAVATIEDLAKIARRRMPKFAFNYLDGGAGDDKGVARNRRQLDDITLKPTLARGVTPTLTTALFDKIYSMPFGIAPTGPNNLLWPNADEILAKVASSANIPIVVSTMATTSIERIAELAHDLTWFQLYPLRSDRVTDDLLDRAWRIGITVVVVTIDVTTDAIRNRDVRGGFNEPGFLRSGRFLFDVGRRPAWALGQFKCGRPKLPNLAPYIGRADIDQETARNAGDLLFHQVTWEHLKRLRKKWKGTLIIKGILDPEDAILAVDIGADAVWVSNHGGRLLESSPAAIDALQQVKLAIGDGAKVLVDGGIRSGEDVVKAGIRGADMVFSGRSLLYGVGAAGLPGAEHGLKLLRDGTARTLAQIGCPAYKSLDAGWAWPPPVRRKDHQLGEVPLVNREGS
jgi:isopentenyl diphosphate isomerase/L-lactate dehydrogenase-like FMN-dependent dehydrogenase